MADNSNADDNNDASKHHNNPANLAGPRRILQQQTPAKPNIEKNSRKPTMVLYRSFRRQ
jgi:hypothetical protein